MSYKSVKFVTDLLKKNGFVFKSQKGSHIKYEKDGKIVIVPNHGSKGIEKGTYHNIYNPQNKMYIFPKQNVHFLNAI